MPRAKKITIERVKECLSYNPETGSIVWKINTAKWNQIGSEAGAKPSKNGYRYISLDRGDYLAQRLAWVIMKGEFPQHHVVFKDGNRSNLKWDNLIEKKVMHKGEFDHSTPEGRSAYGKQWRSENKRSYKNRVLKENFGIGIDRYESMLQAQNGVCSICKCAETAMRNGQPLALSVDHDHATGEIRDLLCKKCNNAIGCFNDNPNLLYAAIDYIKRHKRKAVGNIIPLKKGA